MNALFAVGFSRETGEIELNELFSQHGSVRTLTIIWDQRTGDSKGYAFIHMLDQASADRVIHQLNGIRLGNRTLSVRYADQRHQSLPKGGEPISSFRKAPAHQNRQKRPRLR